MKNVIYFGIAFWMVYILSSCSHSAIPQIYVPQQKGELDAAVSVGVGTSGAHANVIYALTDKLSLQGALEYTRVYENFYREGGIGIKTNSAVEFLSFTYGRGEYGYGVPFYGGDYGVYWHSGYFDKYAMAANIPVSPRFGFVGRISYLEGKESGSNCLICNTYDRLPFQRLFFEPTAYYKFGQKERFFGGFTVRLPTYSKGETASEDAFKMSVGTISFGWNFRVLKGKSKT